MDMVEVQEMRIDKIQELKKEIKELKEKLKTAKVDAITEFAKNMNDIFNKTYNTKYNFARKRALGYVKQLEQE